MEIVPKGQEPANVFARMKTLFAKLDATYPDKVILSLSTAHKKWNETAGELAHLLGYPDGASFLEAYGYTVRRGARGRPGGKPMEVIQELQSRYPNGAAFSKFIDLQRANPDLQPRLKTVANNAIKLFGMSLNDYLQSIGLLKAGQQEPENLIRRLKVRYPDSSHLPQSIEEIKRENPGLPMETLLSVKKLGTSPKKYLQDAGLLAPTVAASPKPELISLTEDEALHYVDILKVRYSHAKHCPENPKQLAGENPDVPVRQLTKYITEHWEEDAKKFYIRNHIFKGRSFDWDMFTFFYVSVYPWLTPFWCCAESADAYYKPWHSKDPHEVILGDYVELQDGTWGKVLQVKSCMGVDAPATPTRNYPPRAVQAISESAFQGMLDRQLPPMPEPDMTDFFQADKQILHYLERLSRDKIPFQPEQFQHPNQRNYSLTQIYFQGQAKEIDRLRDYLLAQGASHFSLNLIERDDRIHTACYLVLSANPLELRNIPSVYMDAITLFPVLRVVGLAEHCATKDTFLFFSESGLGAITHCEEDQTAVQSALKDALRLGGDMDKLYLGFVDTVIPDHGVDYQATQIYWRLKDSNMAIDVQDDIYLKA